MDAQNDENNVFFALKRHHNLAQGNALGKEKGHKQRPERTI
jgi:hypothetical protein